MITLEGSAGQAVRLALGTASALGFARFAYGLLLPAMRDDLGWSLAAAGAMSAANGLGYLVGALATGALVRRFGAAAAFRWGMILTAVALAVTPISGNLPALLTARALAGATGAVVFVTGGVIASRIAARASSSAPIAVYFAGTGLGIVVSGATIPALGAHWRVAWIGLGAAAGLAALVSWTAARTDGDDAYGATVGRARLRPLGRTVVAYALFAAGYISYITFLSAYLADRSTPAAQVALTWTVLGLAVMAAPALWSRPITHWPGSRALAALLAVLGGGAALALAPAPPVILASAVVYGATFMAVPAAVTALIRRSTPPADWTPTLAYFTTVFAAGQTIGPWIAGVLADRTSPDITVAWTAILCAAAAVIAVPVRRSGHPPPTTEAGSPDAGSEQRPGPSRPATRGRGLR